VIRSSDRRPAVCRARVPTEKQACSKARRERIPLNCILIENLYNGLLQLSTTEESLHAIFQACFDQLAKHGAQEKRHSEADRDSEPRVPPVLEDLVFLCLWLLLPPSLQPYSSDARWGDRTSNNKGRTQFQSLAYRVNRSSFSASKRSDLPGSFKAAASGPK